MAPQNNPPFEVYPYNKNHLIDLFSKNSSKQAILKKTQLGYLDGYFSHSDIDAKTIVVENNYIDRDFLEDHAGYYARCFQEYERKCSRLHFFNVSFSKDDLVNLLKNSFNVTSTPSIVINTKLYTGLVKKELVFEDVCSQLLSSPSFCIDYL